jgi:hypothetical protein
MWCDIPLYATMIVCWEAHYKVDNKSIMKQKIKTVLKRIAILFVFVVAMIGIITTTYESVVRPVAVEYLATEEVPFTKESEPVSDYDIWMASEEVKSALDVMYKKHLIAEKQKELDEAMKELESEKEALRAVQVGL